MPNPAVGGSYTAGNTRYQEKLVDLHLSQQSDVSREPCAVNTAENTRAASDLKRNIAGKPQILDSPKVQHMNGPPKRSIIDELRGIKTFLKIVIESQRGLCWKGP